MTDLQKEFFKREFSDCRLNEAMSRHTTFKIGGPAEVFVSCESIDELQKAIKACHDMKIEYFIIGNGSNLLVSDNGINGVVIHASINNIEFEGNKVKVQSGCKLSALAAAVCKKGLSGLEFAAGIPGTVGGAVFMNAGAYGGEMKDVLISVDYIDDEGNVCTVFGDDMDLSYRHSMFSDKNYCIIGCTMELSNGNEQQIRELMSDYNKRRSDKQPLEYPSAGSTFKRPEGYFAGKLIQDSGLSGVNVGDAYVSEKHSGFVINKGRATAADVLGLIKKVQDTVMEKFGVQLEPEVKIIGK